MSYQITILVGHLGSEPEMRFMPSGDPVTNFSIAVSRTYNNKAGEKIEETVWFRIAVYGKAAEACNQYLHKGSQALVEGRLTADKNGSPRIYTRQDGTPGASFEINATTVRFLSGKGDVEGEVHSKEPAAATKPNDDIPF